MVNGKRNEENHIYYVTNTRIQRLTEQQQQQKKKQIELLEIIMENHNSREIAKEMCSQHR